MMPNPSRSMKTVTKMMMRGDIRIAIRIADCGLGFGLDAVADHNRRTALGKSRQTGTPQKCEPSVQRGEIRPLRTTQGGPEVAREPGVDAAHLVELVHRRQVDLFLRVEAGAQRPLVHERQERARLDHPQRRGVGQHVQRELVRHAEREQAVLGVPGVAPSPGRRPRARRGCRREPRRDVIGRGRYRRTSSAAATPAPCGAADPGSRRCGSAASRTCSWRGAAHFISGE